jgi:hypothetical protein
MADEFDSPAEPTFSSFIPLTIFFLGFIVWFGFQDYELNAERSGLTKEFNDNKQALLEAQNYDQHYVALIKDLDATSQRDETAKAILNDAIKGGLISDAVRVGLIHVQAPENNGANPPPPADGTK